MIHAHGAAVLTVHVHDSHHPPDPLLVFLDVVFAILVRIVVALLAPVVALAVPNDAVRAREHEPAPRAASNAGSTRHDVHARLHRFVHGIDEIPR